jgi:hypothetical protein
MKNIAATNVMTTIATKRPIAVPVSVVPSPDADAEIAEGSAVDDAIWEIEAVVVAVVVAMLIWVTDGPMAPAGMRKVPLEPEQQLRAAGSCPQQKVL